MPHEVDSAGSGHRWGHSHCTDDGVACCFERDGVAVGPGGAAAARGGYILDGFPRTVPQAIAAADLGRRLDLTLDAAVYLNVPDPVLIQRLLARARADDTAEVIEHRLQVFAEVAGPLVAYYRDRGILVEVNGDQPPEAITEEIQARLP